MPTKYWKIPATAVRRAQVCPDGCISVYKVKVE